MAKARRSSVTKKSGAARLFISFWDICLENLPEGNITHRRITSAVAKPLIEEARRKGSLLCVTKDDLLAPYHKHERSNHDDLRAVLEEHFGIGLEFRDFTGAFEAEGDNGYSINPLNCVSVSGNARLLVITCCYTLGKRSKRKPLGFSIEPTTVEFHLFERAKPARRTSGRSK